MAPVDRERRRPGGGPRAAVPGRRMVGHRAGRPGGRRRSPRPGAGGGGGTGAFPDLRRARMPRSTARSTRCGPRGSCAGDAVFLLVANDVVSVVAIHAALRIGALVMVAPDERRAGPRSTTSWRRPPRRWCSLPTSLLPSEGRAGVDALAADRRDRWRRTGRRGARLGSGSRRAVDGDLHLGDDVATEGGRALAEHDAGGDPQLHRRRRPHRRRQPLRDQPAGVGHRDDAGDHGRARARRATDHRVAVRRRRHLRLPRWTRAARSSVVPICCSTACSIEAAARGVTDVPITVVYLGGSMLDPRILARAEHDYGIVVLRAYGSSEAPLSTVRRTRRTGSRSAWPTTARPLAGRRGAHRLPGRSGRVLHRWCAPVPRVRRPRRRRRARSTTTGSAPATSPSCATDG